MQLIISCRQKSAKNPLAKNPPKIQQKTPKIWHKNLLHGQKLLQTFNNILTKNLSKYQNKY